MKEELMPRKHNFLYRLFKFIAKVFFSLFYKVEFTDINSIPEKGPLIMCANHISLLDMFLIGYSMKRKIYYIAKNELFKNPLLAFLVGRLGAFPTNRGRPDVRSFRTVLSLLSEGHIVGIFPEGTRVNIKNKDSIRTKPGVAYIAIKSGAPILPVAIEGNYKLFSRLKVVFGQPFKLELDQEKKYSMEELVELSVGVMQKVHKLREA